MDSTLSEEFVYKVADYVDNLYKRPKDLKLEDAKKFYKTLSEKEKKMLKRKGWTGRFDILYIMKRSYYLVFEQ